MTQSLLAGFTPIACGAIGNSVPLIKEGRIRALAITSNKRLATLPDVATLDELGFKNQQAETMTGVFVPAGTPRPICYKRKFLRSSGCRTSRRDFWNSGL